MPRDGSKKPLGDLTDDDDLKREERSIARGSGAKDKLDDAADKVKYAGHLRRSVTE